MNIKKFSVFPQLPCILCNVVLSPDACAVSGTMPSPTASARKQTARRAAGRCWMTRVRPKTTLHLRVNNHPITTSEASWGGGCLVWTPSAAVQMCSRQPDLMLLHRVRLRSDGAAIPRRRSGTDTHSPTRVADTPPRAAACPSSPHKVSISKSRMESPEKRRLGTFGSAGSINYPDRKNYPDGHPLRPVPGATRHSSLGDHKSLETEALAEVTVRTKPSFACSYDSIVTVYSIAYTVPCRSLKPRSHLMF